MAEIDESADKPDTKSDENAPDQSTSAAGAQVTPADSAISLAAKGGADNLLRKVKVVSGVPTEGSDEAAPLAISNPRRPCTPSRRNCAASIRWISKTCWA